MSASWNKSSKTLTALIRSEIQKSKLALIGIIFLVFLVLQAFSLLKELELSRSRLKEWLLGNQATIEQALFLENTLYFSRFEQFENRIQNKDVLSQVIVKRSDGHVVLGDRDIPQVKWGYTRTLLPPGLRYRGKLVFAGKTMGEIYLYGQLPLKSVFMNALFIFIFSFLILLSVRFLLSRVEKLLKAQVIEPIESLSELMSLGTWEENRREITVLKQKSSTKEIQSLVQGFEELQQRIRIFSRELKKVADQSARYDLARQVAHDIRSPLAALKMAITSVRGVDPEVREILLMVSERIESIALDLLDKYPEQPNIEVSPLIKTLSEIQKEKRLEFQGRKDFSFEIQASKTQELLEVPIPSFELRRVLSNLINNSVESYEAEGGPIQISLRTESGEHDKVVVELRDHGKGIPEEFLSQLFIKGNSFRKSGGTGLGLYSAREILRRYHGDLEIISKEGEGTRARLLLPLETPQR